MWIKFNLDGIDFNLQIKNYRPSKIEQWDEQWCKVSCSFVDEKYKIINYNTTENELLLCSEVEGLAIEIEKLLDNRKVEKEVLEFIEPDFEIVLNPNFENDYLSIEWKVYLWSDGLTTNYFSTEFSNEEIKYLLAYLKFVIGEYNNDTPLIKEMINDGILYD